MEFRFSLHCVRQVVLVLQATRRCVRRVGYPGCCWLVVVLVCTWRCLSSSAIEGEEERETRNERVGKDQGASMYGRAMTNRSGAAEQHTVKLEQVPRWIEQERLSPTASSSLSDGGSDRDFLDPLTSGTMIPQSFSLFTS
jgi:hypothetical protein